MAIQLIQSDFELIGQLATHCDKDKLQIAIEESILFDFEPLLCEIFVDVEVNWFNEDENWNNLINGSSYIGCGNRLNRHLGLKRMLLYYAYARYTVMNNFNDTPNGHVTKTNQFSIPKPLKELEQFADKYRSMGYSTWKGVKQYLCKSKEDYPTLKVTDCEDCGCGSAGCKDKAVKGYGIRGNNISKR
jgi:hypothetical protein